MANDISPGEHFVEGELCSAQRLNDHVGDAEILPTFISTKLLKTELTTTDEFVLNDNGVLKKTTIANLMVATGIPAGTVVDFAGLTAPVGWQLCYGQTLSRTTFALLFAAIGTTYGAGDGSSTFQLPDYRGRVLVGKDDMGGTSASRLTGGIPGGMTSGATTLGVTGGNQYHQITTAELASHNHTAPSHVHNNPAHQHYTSTAHQHDLSNHTHGYFVAVQGGSGGIQIGSGAGVANSTTAGPNFNATGVAAPGWSDGGYGATQSDAGNSVQVTTSTGSNGVHNNVQPSIVANKIIKV